MVGLLNRLRLMEAEQRYYTLGSLVSHLRDANQQERLQALFADEAWMYARFESSNQVYDGYLADLDVALEVNVAVARKQISRGREPAVLRQCFRYALINTSLNSIAANYAPTLIARALQDGLWEPAKTLSIVSNIPDPTQQLDTYIAVLETGKLKNSDHDRTLSAALELAGSLRVEGNRPNALARLAPFLSGDLLARAMELVRALKEPHDVAMGLAALISRLTGKAKAAALRSAFDAALSNTQIYQRVEALTALVPHSRGAQKATAIKALLEAASDRKFSEKTRVDTLVGLASHVKGLTKRDVMARAYAAAMRLDDHDLAYSLKAVLKHLHEPLRAEIVSKSLSRVLALPDIDREFEYPRPVGLVALAPFLNGDDLARVKETILNELPDQAAAYFLTSIAGILDEAEKDTLLQAALRWIDQEDFAPSIVSGLTTLLPFLAGEQRDQALRKALNTARGLWDEPSNVGMDPSPRLKALDELTPFLIGESLEEALRASQTIKDFTNRALALVALAASLEGPARIDALDAAFKAIWVTRDDQMGSFSIEEVLPHLEGRVLDEAMEAVMTVPRNLPFNVWGLYVKALAPRLKRHQLSYAFNEAAKVKDPYYRAQVLTALTAQTKGTRRLQALRLTFDTILEIDSYHQHLRAYAIRDVAPYLEGDLVEKGLRLLIQMDRFEKDEALLAITPRLRGPLLRVGLERVSKLEKRYDRIKGLTLLIPCLSHKERETALATAVETAMNVTNEDPDSWKVMIELAPLLKGELRREVLKRGFEFANVGNSEYSAYALAKLAALSEGEMKKTMLMTGLKRSIEIEGTRYSGLLETEMIAKRAAHLNSLFSQMDVNLLHQSLGLLLAMTDRREKSAALVSLVPYMKEKTALLKDIRAFVLERLTSLKREDRDMLLDFCRHPILLAPPVLSRKTVAAMVGEIIEICWDWQWR